jgi:KaiC/GvpD/RAD55 family RecA-like ATPase
VKSAVRAIRELTGNRALTNGITILSGVHGSGKTIFSQQYAYEILQSGGKVLWITTEELPSTLREGMKNFGWDIGRFEAERRFTIYDCVSPARLGLSDNIGHGMLGLDPTGMLIVLTEQLRNTETNSANPEGFLLVLDSISRLLLSCETKAVIDFVSCLNSRMENARVKGFATVSEEVHEEKLLNSILFSSSGTIRFRVRDDNDRRKRQMRVETMRGRAHDDTWKDYEITNSGLDISI